MAPNYAPSLRSCLPPLLFALQTGFIIVYVFYVEIGTSLETDKRTLINSYAEFQDVNVVVFLGFGFLGTFLVRYGFSGSGFSFLMAVTATQWAVILNGIDSLYHRGKILLDLKSLVVAEMCAASALISMGTVLGKTNPVQLLIITLLEVFGFVLNKWLLQTFLNVRPLNSIMLLHIFGTFFGLMLTWVLYQKESETRYEKEKSEGKMTLFSALGTLFLWLFWPSFNSTLLDFHVPGRKVGAIYSTYLALATSTVAAAAVSVVTSPRGKLNLVLMQRCSLAGGVAIGICMSVVHQPCVAMAIGFSASVLSTLGYRYLEPHMLLAFECHDTCGVLSVHGLPGLLGWLAHLLLQTTHSDDITTATRFAVFHICTLLHTLALSMAMGAITGLLLKWTVWRPPQHRKCFDDQAFWEFPHLAERK